MKEEWHIEKMKNGVLVSRTPYPMSRGEAEALAKIARQLPRNSEYTFRLKRLALEQPKARDNISISTLLGMMQLCPTLH